MTARLLALALFASAAHAAPDAGAIKPCSVRVELTGGAVVANVVAETTDVASKTARAHVCAKFDGVPLHQPPPRSIGR